MRLGNISELNDAFRLPVDLFNLCFLHFFLYEKKNSSTTVLRLLSHRPEIEKNFYLFSIVNDPKIRLQK